jgi:hypothetical protein
MPVATIKRHQILKMQAKPIPNMRPINSSIVKQYDNMVPILKLKKTKLKKVIVIKKTQEPRNQHSMASFSKPVSRNSSMTRLSHSRENSISFKSYGKCPESPAPKPKGLPKKVVGCVKLNEKLPPRPQVKN